MTSHAQPTVGTLIHLVSDQTMQNVLPILALRPRRVIQVASDLEAGSGRFKQRCAWIERAVRLAASPVGFAPESIAFDPPVSLSSPNPSIKQTCEAIAEQLAAHPQAVVNYTGGTKNMSIGAWLAASEAGAPSVYCDSPRAFTDGATGELPRHSGLPEIARKLTAEILLASQGLFQNEHWSRHGVPEHQKRLGQVTFELVQAYGEAFREYRLTVLRHGGAQDGMRPDEAALQRALREDIPAPSDPAFVRFLDAAVANGLLKKTPTGFAYNISASHSKLRQQTDAVIRITQGLSGAAFEGYVAQLLDRSARFTDYLSNVYPAGGRPEDQGFGESDFLAYEPSRVALTLISCKCAPPRLEHLESLLARKAKFGGLFARTLLCVEHGAYPQREEILRSHCRSLGIDLAIGEEIQSAIKA